MARRPTHKSEFSTPTIREVKLRPGEAMYVKEGGDWICCIFVPDEEDRSVRFTVAISSRCAVSFGKGPRRES